MTKLYFRAFYILLFAILLTAVYNIKTHAYIEAESDYSPISAEFFQLSSLYRQPDYSLKTGTTTELYGLASKDLFSSDGSFPIELISDPTNGFPLTKIASTTAYAKGDFENNNISVFRAKLYIPKGDSSGMYVYYLAPRKQSSLDSPYSKELLQPILVE